MYRYILSIIGVFVALSAGAYDGTRLWLPDAPVSVPVNIDAPKSTDASVQIAVSELKENWAGKSLKLELNHDSSLGDEGFRIEPVDGKIKLTASTGRGLLYGAYYLLRMQKARMVPDSAVTEVPRYAVRVLNHWDNLDGTVERGYAGRSLWNWTELPEVDSPRYREYARANASIGINGTVLNNVNASSKVLSSEYLLKVVSLADIFRPYGIKVYLSANFAAPMQIGGLSTADPRDTGVIKWWREKAAEIYRLIPDFGGFLVKANSEGQPGPCDFGRTHAEGANMLAEALAPFGGLVMWRAFVYSPTDPDRAKQAYAEFQPLDGQFAPNVIIQIKNGPVDFQPREPYSPLFGAMPSSRQMVEFQVTQEYLGHSNHIAFLAPMWKEFFDYVAPESIDAVAGVANIGDSANWTGHPFAQANWYAFGRLAWNPDVESDKIAREWLDLSISDGNMPDDVYGGLVDMMLESREAVVDYMMPMGLHHLFAFGHHYGPEPWCEVTGARADWLPKYYHRADSIGLGFDRTLSGTRAVEQYPEGLSDALNDPDRCPEDFLLWFHHVPWNKTLQSGDTMWNTLCRHYERGVESVKQSQCRWDAAAPYLDAGLYADVRRRLMTQARDARWWKDACLLYFQEFSGLPFPDGVTAPEHTLETMKGVNLGITNYESPSVELLDAVR
ncbi:MAG: alpha-glucuronidase [Muribaculum sp.]|nr:alpha-glucuronidase [Muribaculum sp.]